MVWIVKNICGVICVLIAWVLLIFAQYTILAIVLIPRPDTTEKYTHILVFEFFSALAFIAHLKTILTDPGSVPQKNATPEYIRELESKGPQTPNNVVYKCAECCSVKPERAHHCSVCKRCIRKMDHHCPWVNNCVGERNQKYFVLFTLYISIISFHALFLTVNHLLNCLENDWNSSHGNCVIMNGSRPAPGKLIMLVFLVFLSLLFSLFSMIMFYIQMKAVWTDQTGIENLKNESRHRVSRCKSLQEVCGRHYLLWLSPFTKPPSNNDSLTNTKLEKHIERTASSSSSSYHSHYPV